MAESTSRQSDVRMGQLWLRSKIDSLTAATGASLRKSPKKSFLDFFWPILRKDYKLMVDALIELCENEMRERGISATVDGRVKVASSIDKTMDRREEHRVNEEKKGPYQDVRQIVQDMHDLAGIRIVVDYPSQLEQTNRFITSSFQKVKEPNYFTRDRVVGKQWSHWFGAYESYNHHVTLKPGAQKDLEGFLDVVFEIQLTSLPESLYNRLAHPILYKKVAGNVSRQDEMVIDLSHGLSLCFALTQLYWKDRLHPDSQDTSSSMQGLQKAMRNIAISSPMDSDVSEDRKQLAKTMQALVNQTAECLPSQEPESALASKHKKVSKEIFTSILSTLPEDCGSTDSLWTFLVGKVEGKMKAVESALSTAFKNQTAALQGHFQDEGDKNCLKSLFVTNPSDDKKRIEHGKGGLLEDAYRWIISHDDYVRFSTSDEHRLLWIKGNPGKGKTMLLCGLIDTLKAQGSHAISYFFCEATLAESRKCASAVLRSLIWVLCSEYPGAGLVTHVRKKFENEGKNVFDDANAFFALQEILIKILQQADCPEVVFIVDALDECSDDTRPDLIQSIIDLSESSQKAKWIVSSRNWESIQEQLQQAENIKVSLELNKDSVSKAVDGFIHYKVAYLTRVKGYDEETERQVLDTLRRKADDTFLWVALVCAELAKPKLRPWNTLKTLEEMPKGLEKLYERMVRQVISSDDSNICKEIIAITCIAARPLMLQELPVFVRDLERFKSSEVLHQLVGECGSFLYINDETIFFVHQSAQEFLTGTGWGHMFQSTIEYYHLILFRRSLSVMQVLRRNMYGLSSPGVLVDEVSLPQPDPIANIQYFCRYWVHHLEKGGYEQHSNDDDLVYSFLQAKLLNWLEALSLQGRISEALIAMRKLRSFAVLIAGRSSKLKDLAQDVLNFVLSFKRVLELAPLQVYVAALLFAPSSSLIKRLHNDAHPRWVTMKLGCPADWDAIALTLEGHKEHVSRLSMSPNGEHLVSVSSDGNVRSWDVEGGRCKHSFTFSRKDSPKDIAVSPDGQMMAMCHRDPPTVQIRSLGSAPTRIFLESPNDIIEDPQCVEFSSDGKQLAAIVDKGLIQMWDPATGACTHTLRGSQHHKHEPIRWISFSPDSSRLAASRQSGMVEVWEIKTGTKFCLKPREIWGIREAVTFVTETVLSIMLPRQSGKRGYEFALWDTRDGSCTTKWESKQDDQALAVSFNQSGVIATASIHGSVSMWDLSGNRVQTLMGHGSPVVSFAFSPDTSILATGSFDTTIKLWDVSKAVATAAVNNKSDLCVLQSQETSQQGRQAVTIPENNASKIFSEDTKTHHRSDSPHTTMALASQTISSHRCSTDPNAPTTASGSKHSDRVRRLNISPNGKFLVSESTQATLMIWDVASCEFIQRFNGNASYPWGLHSLEFSPDGQWVQMTSEKQDTLLCSTSKWETEKLPCMPKSSSHGQEEFKACFSSDSRFIVIPGNRSTLLKCLQTGEIQNIRREGIPVILSSDSRILVLAMEESICAYDIATHNTLWEVDCAIDRDELSNVKLALSHDCKRLAVYSRRRFRAWRLDVLPPEKIFDKEDRARNTVRSILVNEQWLMVSYDLAFVVYSLGANIQNWTINHSLQVDAISFDPCNYNCFHTNAGSFAISEETVIRSEGLGISLDGAWITNGTERLVWLPPQYQKSESIPAVQGSLIALGSTLKDFTLLEFT